jgi:hypothetical protein
MTIPAPPTLQEFLNAANAVDRDNGNGVGPSLYPPASAGFMLVMDSTAVNQAWLSDGMFAQAFMDSKGDIIVAFDSSIINPNDPNFHTPYANSSEIADAEIALGITPQAFLDADAFVRTLEHNLGARYLSTHPIYLEGHSLGGAEAEYVGNAEHLGGVTFGAPGTRNPTYGPGGSIFDLQSPSFINFIDRGDPVGNFGNHYGSVVQVGTPWHGWVAAADPVDALQWYHPLANYAADLGLNPNLGK